MKRKRHQDVADQEVAQETPIDKKPDSGPVKETVIEPEQVAVKKPEPSAHKTSSSARSQKSAGGITATRGFFHDGKTNRFFNNGKTPLALKLTNTKKGFDNISVNLNDQGFIPYTGLINIEQEGINHLSFRAKDSTGKEIPVQDFKVYIDHTPPTITSFWHGPHVKDALMSTVTGNSYLALTAKDNLSGVSKIVVVENDEQFFYKTPMKFPDGKHKIIYYAIDNVGNKSQEEEIEFAVDSVAPTTTASISGPIYKAKNAVYVNSSATISLAANETTSGIERTEYKINSSAITTYHSPIHMFEPKMTVRYRSIDKVGNIEESKPMNIVVDSTPPQIGLGPHGQYIVRGNKIMALTGFYIYIDAKDTESGIAEIQVTRDGKNYEKTNERNIIFDKPGEFHVSVRATDRVENVKESNSYIVLISDEGPNALLPDN
jgi:hypothetical protein